LYSARSLQKEWEWKEKRRKFLENKSNKCPLKEEVIKSIKKRSLSGRDVRQGLFDSITFCNIL